MTEIDIVSGAGEEKIVRGYTPTRSLASDSGLMANDPILGC